LPDPCGLGSDSHGGKAFSDKLLEFLTQTGSQLNFGDCMSYAVAKAHGVPLLFKGDDFSKTDIAAVAP
jgi:uncharacterized protein with PIN domain